MHIRPSRVPRLVWRGGLIATVAAAIVCAEGTARAFDSKGHVVIEALVYRTLVEGHGDRPPAPDVLRDLINDGALIAPICYGPAASATDTCRGASLENPLLQWPEPRTDRPDAAFRRQFSDAGQCYHFMGTDADEASPPLEGSRIPRALATTAVARCRDLLDQLLRQIVIVGGPGTRESGNGLYELMHSVGDSFSLAHTQRTATHEIAFLRVWEPIGKLAGDRLGATFSMSPTRHDSSDVRDKAYVRNFTEVEGRPCESLTDAPYEVPFACLSEEGDSAREALADLLVLVRNLRRTQLAAGPHVDTRPEQSDAWKTYKEKWLKAATECRGEECDARQPPERVPSGDFLLGVAANYNPTQRSYGATLRGMLMKYSWDLNPFVYGITADVGYRRQYDDGSSYGIAALELDLFLPVGRRAAIGFVPAVSGYAFGPAAHSGPQLLTQTLRFDILPVGNLWLGVAGPGQIDWITTHFAWAFSLTAGVAPSGKETPSGTLLRPSTEEEAIHDDAWAPPPPFYGHLKGRKASWYVIGATTADTTPAAADPDTFYGAAGLGASVFLDRDAWDERYPFTYGASLELGLRRTAADHRYLTGALGIELRWYPLKVLGFSLVPVRVEGGPRVGGTGADASVDIYGAGGAARFFQVGSRVGVALNLGLVDLVVLAPTLVWNPSPVYTGEIVTFQIGFRVR